MIHFSVVRSHNPKAKVEPEKTLINSSSLIHNLAFSEQTEDNTSEKYILSIDTFVCFVREVEMVAVVVTERAFLTSAFREAEEDVVVEEQEEEAGGKVMDCFWGKGDEVEVVVVFKGSLGGALLRCMVSCFPVDPPPFCDGLCLTTFRSSIWVSAVP